MVGGVNSLKTKQTLTVKGKSYSYFSLPLAAQALGDISHLPYSLKVLLENLLRNEDGKKVTRNHIKALVDWGQTKKSEAEIPYHPVRIVMQDFTGVPGLVDLAAMRDAVKTLGKNPEEINPRVPVDLVIDHSLQVDYFGSPEALKKNVELEYRRNVERYEFLKWGTRALKNFRVIPPGMAIIHQANLEYLAQTVWVTKQDGETWAFCDSCVGTDSHTTMINGLSVLGWGVGGIEAEAAMLGQAVTMIIPEVVGFRLTGQLGEGVTATDLVLQIVQQLRAKGVVGKFVEFCGPGMNHLSLADRATLANMAPEYGATCGFFPIDRETINYLRFTGRAEERVNLVEAYAKAQGLWRDQDSPDPEFTSTLELDISTVVPNLAGHKRPQDRITLETAPKKFQEILREDFEIPQIRSWPVKGQDYQQISDGDVVVAAITSCTNTSNPSVLVAAGLLARNAIQKGLQVKPWVKTSFAPGSQVVSEYLKVAGLLSPLEQLGFHIVGYGCTTCIGNSGPLPPPIAAAVEESNLVVSSVLSGNRNFEGRISPQVKANFLASPPLVVAYALAGSINVNLPKEPLGQDHDGKDVYLRDLWPSNQEVKETISQCLSPRMFQEKYDTIFDGDQLWQQVKAPEDKTYQWRKDSSYIQRPPYFDGITLDVPKLQDIKGARPLALLGPSVTTDHISPAGAIASDSPAGKYLREQGVAVSDFNSYGSRRGNHEVMVRGTFANIRLRNEMAPGREGSYTKKWPEGREMSIFDAAMEYQRKQTPMVVVAGSEYGTGSSRDWAAKGTSLLGVKAVIAESFERIHRSNLIGMGVLPLELPSEVSKSSLQLEGTEVFHITGVKELRPRGKVTVTINRINGKTQTFQVHCRLNTKDEMEYYRHGGILSYVLRHLKGD